jgi:hypothetical protein
MKLKASRKTYERFEIHKQPAGHRLHTNVIKECVWEEEGGRIVDFRLWTTSVFS